jgi:hypothetical protein
VISAAKECLHAAAENVIEFVRSNLGDLVCISVSVG